MLEFFTMKSNVFSWMMGVVVAGMGMFPVVGCNSGADSSTSVQVPTRDTVKISGMQFNPNDLKVNKGDTVVFINDDIVTHDVTDFPGKSWTSGPLDPGNSWERQFDDSASYFCSIHPTMFGKVEIK